MKINELARPRRAQQAAEVFESYFGNRIRISEMTHRQARVMLGRVRDMLAEERGKRSFHSSEQNPAYMKLLMIEGVLRQRLNEDDAPMGAGVATTPDQKKAAQDQANKMKQAQLQQINKVKDPNVKGAMTAAVQGKSMTPDQQQALANAAMASGAVNEDQNDDMVEVRVVGNVVAALDKAHMDLDGIIGHQGKNATHFEVPRSKVAQFVRELKRGGGLDIQVNDGQVNELSKDTLKSYAKKAAMNAIGNATQVGRGDEWHGAGTTDKAFRKVMKRKEGIGKAIDRLANESVQHSLRRALTEAELQQAQVVLAAKDLGDRVQKMLEEASSMTYKDLPALTDQIRSEVGVPQADQYNQQVTALLNTLVQSIQTTKAGLDAAMGIVTGQEMTVPGEEAGAEMGMAPPAPEMGMSLEPGAAPDLGAEMPAEEPTEEPGTEIPGALGRERR